MPDTHLILHVKGTESQTTQLHRDEVRAGVWEGKISQTQLIWRPAENTWKPVRDLPELIPPVEHLILHVKGTESETRQLPKPAVRAAISKGDITHSQLIWRPSENTWKQVRELPELLPSQKLAPAPAHTPAPVVVAPAVAEKIIPESPDGPVARAVAGSAGLPKVQVAASGTPVAKPQPRVATPAGTAKPAVAPVAKPTPQARVAGPDATKGIARMKVSATIPKVAGGSKPAPAQPQLVRSTGDLEIKHDPDHANPFKIICLGLGALILAVVGANYFFVDRPLVSALGETEFSGITAYAHLGAFMQPNVVIVHVPKSSMIIGENFTKFLVTLARSTPNNPVTHDLFGRVALTSGWTAQYSFSGYTWKQLGDMGKDTEDARKEFLMDQLADAGGQPLMPQSTLSENIQTQKREQIWQQFVSTFEAKP